MLSLESCWKLRLLPEGIGRLAELEDLNLSDCHGLTESPPAVGDLSGLKTLNLGRCEKIAFLPEVVSQLTGLEKLVLRGGSFREIPESSSALVKLQFLDLSFCRALKELPERLFDNMAELQELLLTSCGVKALPENTSCLIGLTDLDVTNSEIRIGDGSLKLVFQERGVRIKGAHTLRQNRLA